MVEKGVERVGSNVRVSLLGSSQNKVFLIYHYRQATVNKGDDLEGNEFEVVSWLLTYDSS